MWLALGAVMGLEFRTSLGWWVDLLAGVVLAYLLSRLAALLLPLAGWLVSRLRQLVGWLGVALLSLMIGQLSAWGLPVPQVLALVAGVLFAAAILGGSVSFLLSSGWRRLRSPQKSSLITAGVMSVVLLAALVGWLRWPGTDDHLLLLEGLGLDDVAALELEDPGQPGPFGISSLTYGSGNDRHRAEFGDQVTVVTESVDGTAFFAGIKGLKAKLRRLYWGFDMEQMPLNGRVWYPCGEGPFPIVLMVHGNHNMDHYSDPGYAYLGELLASHGVIFVSVDENFLNGHLFGGPRLENDARGWLLLQHLTAWRRWNSDPESLFFRRADLDRVVLMGHSRGGEAAAIAASFNHLRHYPDDAKVDFDFDFGIKGVLAIAPSDGQYRPSDVPTPLRDVNYLVIQGGHDGDVSSFSGDRQYERVQLTPGSGTFKASLYAYRANHGQFNTVWGRSDLSPPFAWLLNLRPLLPMEDQLRIARTYISAFVAVTVQGREEYQALFRDPRRGRSWLPEDLYLSRFQDASFQLLADFQEDIDVTSGSLPGVVLEARDLTVWREEDVSFRGGGRRENKAVYLGWKVVDEAPLASGEVAEPPAQPRFTLRLPRQPAVVLGAAQRLVFDLAATEEEAPEPQEEDREDSAEESAEEQEKSADDEPAVAIDFTLELEARDGSRTRLTLARLRPLPPPLKSRYTKLKSTEKRYGDGAEVLFQTYELPLTALGLEYLELAAIRLIFDLQPTGVIILDQVGIAGEPPPVSLPESISR